MQVLRSEKKPSIGAQETQFDEAESALDTAEVGKVAAKYWQSLWPDDDDDVNFFPHIDLESVEIAEAEEDATRL